MTQAQNHIEGNLRTPEIGKSKVLSGILKSNRTSQVRREIGIIADRSYRENLITDEAYGGYKEIARGREGQELSTEMLESTRKFAKEYEAKAMRIHKKIEAAKRSKIASDADEEFLMQALVVGNIEFASRAGEAEALIDQKLQRMKKDKERYLKLDGHKLIKDIGYLKVNTSTRIDFPNEEAFLKMTVPERRELLQKLEESLAEAEGYAAEHADAEAGERVREYTAKLDDALKEGVIGKKTHAKFLKGFKGLSESEERNHWLAEFDSEMQRYRVLWGNIRGTLQGEALKAMEVMIDEKGYTELFTAFGTLKASETARLKADYAGALETYREKGIVGRHTIAQFNVWMQQQDLSAQYDALNQLDGEMQRYEELWDNTKSLKKSEQNFLRSKIDVWGYTELSDQFQAFVEGRGSLESESEKTADAAIMNIRSAEVRRAVIETGEMLDERGDSKKKSFSGMLRRMFGKASSAEFDATSFETELDRKRAKLDPLSRVEVKGRGASDTVVESEIEEDVDQLEEVKAAHVVEEEGFLQVETRGEGGNLTQRDTLVQMNDDRSLDRFMTEDSKRAYRSEKDGGTDDVSLAIQTQDGRTVELELQEIRHLEGYLNASNDNASEEKAAA
ncbi:MAG: hypothetical protein OEY44_00635 [Candidatus Peregrinibacteria bacterium]|nr:hypothetical protein [Candidatus Peregrinibacteria bacterium]